MPVTIHDAVQIAASHLKILMPAAEQITLEEAEISDDDQYWLITLGLNDPEAVSPLINALGGLRRRKYKVIKINRETGEVRGMKMRQYENV